MKWVERLNAYEKLMRLDKPIGIFLLLWPTLWGIWIVSVGHPNWVILWIFILGTVLMRSAGCILNDYADRNIDPLVARTKDRPLATGLVSPKEALVLASVLVLLAFLLILRLNKLTLFLSVAALFLAASYPYTKRFLAIPQAYLGIAFGFGIPMAFAAYSDAVPPLAWILLVANVFWAIAYDTEYAMVDREDDSKIGVKSSALFFGQYDIAAILVSFGIMLSILLYVGLKLNFGVAYYSGLVVALGMVFYQYRLIKDRDPAKCFTAFRSNNWLGLAIFAGIAIHYASSGTQ